MSTSLKSLLAATTIAGLLYIPPAWSGLPLSLSRGTSTEKAEAYFEKGHRALDDKKVVLAESCYRKAIQLEPGEARYHRQLAFVLLNTGRGQEAEREARIAMHLDDKDWKSYIMLGKIMHAQGRIDEEVAIYQKAIKIMPAEEQALKDKLAAYIKADEAAKKAAIEKNKKKQEEEERKYKNAY